jgi:nitrous oxide reductase accessory protein NosL
MNEEDIRAEASWERLLGAGKKGKEMNRFFAALCVLFLMGSMAQASDDKPAKPSNKEKCPVCGMFVAKYPDWIGRIAFKDGSMAFFDGAKDLFKYYFNLKKYRPGKTAADIQAVHVTEYYQVHEINAHKAVFVLGSDVYGPMGRELIPFANEEDAKVFMKDHQGKKILRFDEINPAVIEKLD